MDIQLKDPLKDCTSGESSSYTSYNVEQWSLKINTTFTYQPYLLELNCTPKRSDIQSNTVITIQHEIINNSSQVYNLVEYVTHKSKTKKLSFRGKKILKIYISLNQPMSVFYHILCYVECIS